LSLTPAFGRTKDRISIEKSLTFGKYFAGGLLKSVISRELVFVETINFLIEKSESRGSN